MESRKYSRTYHFPFSPGTTSDDRIAKDWEVILEKELLMTEKLDGENTCLKKSGVYARSHAAPTISPWSVKMRELWEYHKNSLDNLEIFGESLYAIHSIEYERLDTYFFIFAIRQEDRWLSWEEVVFYAQVLSIPTVPIIDKGFFTKESICRKIAAGMKEGSRFGGECEGFVFRNIAEFHVDSFAENVLKYVRKNHVKTDEHWTRNWKKAKLWFEEPVGSAKT